MVHVLVEDGAVLVNDAVDVVLAELVDSIADVLCSTVELGGI